MGEIVEVSAKIFRQKGYSGTSIQDIADAVGILKGSLYHYIDSKEDLLFAIVEDIAKETESSLTPLAQDKEREPLEILRDLVLRHAVLEVRTPIRSAVFFRDGHHLSGKRRKWVLGVAQAYEEAVEGVIERGQGEGTLRDDIDAALAMQIVFGTLNSIYLWYRPRRRSWSAEEIGAACTGIILDGLTSDRSPRMPAFGSD